MKKSNTVGIFTLNLFDSYQTSIFSGIKDSIKNLDLDLLCFSEIAIDDFDINRKIPSIPELINNSDIDILLLISGPMNIRADLETLKKYINDNIKKLVISVGINIPGFPCVIVDNKKGMEKLIHHLIKDHDRKRIAFIKGPEKNEEAKLRFEGYCNALNKHGINYDPELVLSADFNEKSGKEAVSLLIKNNKNIDALVGSDDEIAIGALNQLKENNFKIPDEIIVAGFDDIEKSNYHLPSLTTVHQPLFELGSSAVQKAVKIINNIKNDRIEKIETHLVRRESCGCIDGKLQDDTSFEKLELFENSLVQERILKEIYKIYNIKNTGSPGNKYLIRQIKKLIKAALESIKDDSEKNIKDVIENVIPDAFKKGLRTSFWNGIINDVFTEKSGAINFTGKKKIIKKIWEKSQIAMYRTEGRVQASERISFHELIGRFQRIEDRLITCFNLDELKLILRDNLPEIGINHCFIYGYDRSGNKSESRLLFALNKNNKHEGKNFPYYSIVPPDIKFSKSISFMILPLIGENFWIGHIVVEITDLDFKIYESLAGKVASALKGAELFKKVKMYASELEAKIEEHTAELIKANKLLKEQSFNDELTGLRNRRFLSEVILPEAKNLKAAFLTKKRRGNDAVKTKNNRFGVIMIDLDFFKEINDLYGHMSGDMVLKQLGTIFIGCVRNNDFVIRIGGEEFLLILREFDSFYLTKKAEEIRKAVEKYPFLIGNGDTVKRTCSIGCTIFPASESTPETIDFMTSIALADEALYYAKWNGRNKAIVAEFNEETLSDIKNIEKVFESFEWGIETGKIRLVNCPELKNCDSV